MELRRRHQTLMRPPGLHEWRFHIAVYRFVHGVFMLHSRAPLACLCPLVGSMGEMNVTERLAR